MTDEECARRTFQYMKLLLALNKLTDERKRAAVRFRWHLWREREKGRLQA